MTFYFKKIKLIQLYIAMAPLLLNHAYAQDASSELGVEYDEVKQISIAGLDVSQKITHAQAIKIFGAANIDEIETGEGDKVEYSTLIVPYKKGDIFYKIPWETGYGNIDATDAAYENLLSENAAFYTEFFWRKGNLHFPSALLINNTLISQNLTQATFVKRYPKSALYLTKGWHAGETKYKLSLCPYDSKLEDWVDVSAVWFTFSQNKLIAFEYSAGSCALNNETD